MVSFLVRTAVTLPDWSQGELDALRRKEKSVAHALQREGIISALWRVTGQLAAYGIWQGQDRDAVEASVARLPFRPFMEVDITELSDHPYALNPFPVEHQA